MTTPTATSHAAAFHATVRRVPALFALMMFAAVWPLRAASDPLATLTISSLTELQSSVTRFARAVQPNKAEEFGRELSRELGVGADTAYDSERPWQLAVWFEGMPNPPVVALKVPTDDIEQFKATLDPERALRKQGLAWEQLNAGYGLVLFTPTEALAEPQQTALDAWKAKPVAKPGQTALLATRLSEPLRQQGLLLLGFGRLAVSQNISTNKAFTESGINPNAMANVFAIYFEVLENVVQGLDRLDIGLALREDALHIEDVITAKPDTILAGWLTKPSGSIPAGHGALMDPAALMSFAGRMDTRTDKTDLMSRFVTAGFQMQNIPAEDPALTNLQALMKSMFPVSFAGSIHGMDTMSFSGVYAFPESKAGSIYAEVKKFFATGMQSVVGKDKMYESVSFKEKHRVLGGVNVDRFVLALNTNSLMFSMPGQMEQFSTMFPGGKLELDYALQGDRLFVASPDRMPALLDPAAAPKTKTWTGTFEADTILVGAMNVIRFATYSVQSNPMVPAPLKAQLAALNGEGTEVDFRVSVNQGLRINSRLPLRMFTEFSKLAAQPPPEPK